MTSLIAKLDANPKARRTLIGLVFLLGALPMVAHLLNRGTFWGDEAALALNIGPRGFFEMGRPFTLRQVCPWLTMAAIKSMTVAFGPTERAFRLVPLISALLASGLAYHLGRRVAGLVGGIVAMLIAVTSFEMVNYSAELKPYTTDAAMAAGIMLAALRVLEAPESRPRLAVLAGLGVVAGWVSLPSLFVLAAAGLALGLEALHAKRGVRHLALLGGMGAAWLIAFYVHFSTFVAVSELATSPGVAKYWEKDFAPFPPTSLTDLRWYVGKFFYTFATPVHLSNRYLAGLAFLSGAGLLFTRSRRFGLLVLVGPWGFALIAATMGRYPPVGRLMIFMVPGLAAVIAVAVATLADSSRRWRPAVAGALVLLLVAPGVGEVWGLVPSKPSKGDLKVALTALAPQLQPGDMIYIAEGGNHVVWDYYAPELGLTAEVFTINDPREFGPDGTFPKLPQMEATFGRARVWLLTPTKDASWDPEEDGESNEALSAFLTRYIDKCGGQVRHRESFEDQDIILYDLTAARLPEGRARIENPAPAAP